MNSKSQKAQTPTYEQSGSRKEHGSTYVHISVTTKDPHLRRASDCTERA